MLPSRSSLIILALSLSIASGTRAQAPDVEPDVSKSIRETLFAQGKAFEFESRARTDEPAKLRLHDRSLLNWTNPLRFADVGIVVLWEDEGLSLIHI